MKSPTQALLWEQYRQTRWQIAVVALLFFAYVPFSPTIVEFENLMVFLNGDISPDFNTWFLLFALMPALFINPQAKDIEESLPRRLLSLPVTTKQLVLTQLFYKLGILVLFGLLISLLNHFQFDSEIPAWWAFLVLVALTTSYQAYIFSQGNRFSIARILTITCLICALFFLLQIFSHALKVSPDSWFEVAQLPDQRYAALLCLIVIATAVPLCFHNLRKTRSRESNSDTVSFLSISQALPNTHKQKATFRSPLTAQMWFEWRQTLWVLPVIFAACTIPYAINVRVYPLAGILAIILFPAIPVLAGYYLMRVTASYREFVLTRPTDTRRIANAKLYAGAWATIPAMLLPTLATVLFISPQVFGEAGANELFRAFAGFLTAILAATWIALTMGRLAMVVFLTFTAGALICILVEYLLRVLEINWQAALEGQVERLEGNDLLIIISVAAILILLAINYAAHKKKWIMRRYLPYLSILLFPAFWFALYLENSHDVVVALYITITVSIFPMAILFCEAYLRNLISPKAIRNTAFAIALTVSCSILLILKGYHYTDEANTIIIFGLLSLAPFAWVPLVIHFRRHR
jgi:hypothetical protein